MICVLMLAAASCGSDDDSGGDRVCHDGTLQLPPTHRPRVMQERRTLQLPPTHRPRPDAPVECGVLIAAVPEDFDAVDPAYRFG